MTPEAAAKWAKLRKGGRTWFIWSAVAYFGLVVPVICLGVLGAINKARHGEFTLTVTDWLAGAGVGISWGWLVYWRAKKLWEARESEYVQHSQQPGTDA
jgi:hypothetical protein